MGATGASEIMTMIVIIFPYEVKRISQNQPFQSRFSIASSAISDSKTER